MSWNLLVNQDIHFFPLPGHTKGAIMACPSSVVLVVQELRHQLYLVPITELNMGVSIKNVILQNIKNSNWDTLKG